MSAEPRAKVLEVVNVGKRFGSLVAVDDVSLAVERGELRAIIGPNGAGKTTFFNLISGFFPPSAGKIVFDGRDVTSMPAHQRVGAGMARTFQITEIFPELSVYENLQIGAESAAGYRLRPWTSRAEKSAIRREIDAILDLSGLAGKVDRLVGELAHGDQRVAEIAMALTLRPRLLLLDEPTAGMGDQETYAVTKLIRDLHRGGEMAIVLIEHDMRVVFGLADRITVLDQGGLLAEGSPQEIAANAAVQTGLFGEGGMTAALAAEGLHTYYGKSHILHGVDIEVAEGKITALLGRNGAGKTTTLRSLMGLTPARSGRITIFGQDTTRWPPYRVAASGVGYVPEGRRVFANLSVEENLKTPLERAGPWTIARVYQLFPRLAERRRNRGRQLSGGEQEMLAIARALMLNPRLLMLDEPSQGLAPLVVAEVFRIVAAMRDEGISILLVEQNALMSLEIADHAYVSTTARSCIPARRGSWPATKRASRRWPASVAATGRRFSAAAAPFDRAPPPRLGKGRSEFLRRPNSPPAGDEGAPAIFPPRDHALVRQDGANAIGGFSA